MANRNRRNIRRKRRGARKGRKGTNVRSTGGVSVNPKTAGVARMRTIRAYEFFPKQISSTGAPTSSWLENLYNYGVMAMKIFALLQQSNSLTATTTALINCACTCLLIRVEDLLLSSPVDEVQVGDVTDVHYCDFRQFRLHTVQVVITSGSVLAERAGRFAAALIPLSREESDVFRSSDSVISDSATIQQIMQYPHSVVAPYGRAVTLRSRPSGFQAMTHAIGTPTLPTSSDDLKVGSPLYKLLLAYQDFAANSADPIETTKPTEVMLHVEVSANVSLIEPGRRYYGMRPQLTMSSNTVNMVSGSRQFEVPVESCRAVARGVIEIDSVALQSCRLANV